MAAFTPINTSNSVITGSTDTKFDLPMIFRFFCIGGIVLKTQFNNRQKELKGETDCKTFFNQITFGLKNKANVKLFNNGNFQISGVKTIEAAKQNLMDVLKLLPGIKGEVIDAPTMVGKICCYNNKVLVENEGRYTCKSSYKNGFFIIDGEVCVVSDFDDRIFISNKHLEKKKKLYNINCEYIGFLEYSMKRKSKNLCLKGAYFTKDTDGSYTIHDKYINATPIGVMKINITGDIIDHRSPSKVVIDYFACKENPEILNLKLANVNCNMKYILPDGDSIDRELLCSFLSQNEIKYNFDPCKYPGVKIDYQNTKITIFRTGSILFSGKEELQSTIKWVSNIFNENDLVKKSIEFEEIKTEISIWDILES
jgi:TATA-box binding protein (TBP) (component of TFIID and TFIIIB)